MTNIHARKAFMDMHANLNKMLATLQLEHKDFEAIQHIKNSLSRLEEKYCGCVVLRSVDAWAEVFGAKKHSKKITKH